MFFGRSLLSWRISAYAREKLVKRNFTSVDKSRTDSVEKSQHTDSCWMMASTVYPSWLFYPTGKWITVDRTLRYWILGKLPMERNSYHTGSSRHSLCILFTSDRMDTMARSAWICVITTLYSMHWEWGAGRQAKIEHWGRMEKAEWKIIVVVYAHRFGLHAWCIKSFCMRLLARSVCSDPRDEAHAGY